MPLGLERPQNSESQIIELDFLVLPKHLQEFTKELSKSGFRERKRPPIKRHHKIFQKFHGSQCITLDIQIGPRFDRGVIFHLAPIKALSKILFSVDTRHSLDLTASGRAVLYAANCAWLKKDRLKETNLEKLQQLSRFAISCGDHPTWLRPILERLSRVSDDYKIDESRTEIVEMIRGLFVLKVNNPYHSMKRFFTLLRIGSAKILFLGPDGSGKTSLLRATQSVLPLKSSHGYLGIGEDGWKLGLVKSLSAKRK